MEDLVKALQRLAQESAVDSAWYGGKSEAFGQSADRFLEYVLHFRLQNLTIR